MCASKSANTVWATSCPRSAGAGFAPAWEQRKADEVFRPVDDRGHPGLPVLSATQGFGMVRRDESGRLVDHDEAAEAGYKRVRPGDFVVHLRSFQGGFAHSPIEGIASPAYTVFAACDPGRQHDRFWKHVFGSRRFVAALAAVTYGIRDGRSISFEEFLGRPVAFPSFDEQRRIAAALDRLDSLITLRQREGMRRE